MVHFLAFNFIFIDNTHTYTPVNRFVYILYTPSHTLYKFIPTSYVEFLLLQTPNNTTGSYKNSSSLLPLLPSILDKILFWFLCVLYFSIVNELTREQFENVRVGISNPYTNPEKFFNGALIRANGRRWWPSVLQGA